MNTIDQPRFIGKEIFFNFIEIEKEELPTSGKLVRQLRNGKLDGFVIKNLFSQSEIEQFKRDIAELPEEIHVRNIHGSMFPAPFSFIQNGYSALGIRHSEIENLTEYFNKLNAFYDFIEHRSLSFLVQRVKDTFSTVAADFDVKLTVNRSNKKPMNPGTLRFFKPNLGGLNVHCGNYFQTQTEVFYNMIDDDIDMADQLSFFMVIQNGEEGGELTIYDMLWKDIKRKAHPDDNEYVLKDDGAKLYLKDLRSFAVKPQPGDLLIFQGGPIWHRVEDIKGNLTRITFAGFMNFSKDNTGLFHWS